MNLVSLTIHELKIPFRFGYGHSSAKHTGVRSIICVARDSDGNCGYGEAVPRSYVTGESTASVQKELPFLTGDLDLPNRSFPEIRERLRHLETDRYPQSVPACAICAVDLAVTDLFARQQDESVVEVLHTEGGPGLKTTLEYTASIGISSRSKLTALLLLYRSMGIRHYKVKVGNDSDMERLKLIRRILGSDVTLFADANGAWNRETAVAGIERLGAFRVWAIEEPLAMPLRRTDQHFADNAWIQDRSPIPLIADESLISLRSAQKIVEHGAFRIFNIRLSKCGGYARATQFAEIARSANLSFSLGAMVGESPVLAAAGAAWGACHPDHLYIQGHSHRVLHGASFATGCPPLKHGGIHTTPDRNGTGLSIETDALEAVTVNQTTIDLT